MGAARAITTRAAAASATLALLFSCAPLGASAAETDLEARVKSLEERVESLAKAVEERDAEIARLREERDAKQAPRWSKPRGGGTEDEAIKKWRGQFGRLDGEMRRELERLGLDWGLPGHTFKRAPGPIELMPTRRAFLGIEMEEGERGVTVADVVADSPAGAAGLEAGDLIVEIDGREVFRAEEIARLVGGRRPGDALSITVERDGRTLALNATLATPSGSGARLRGPSFRFAPFGRGTGPDDLTPLPGTLNPAPDAAEGAGADTIDVDVPVPGGRARVRFAAPGLFMSDELAGRLKLTGRERRDVEDAFAEARGRLAEDVADEIAKSGGRADSGVVTKLRRKAEAAACGLLAGKLPEEKLAALEREQAEAGANVSVSVRSSTGTGGVEPGKRRIEDSLEEFFKRAQEF
jgi:hypothetical protein